MLNFGGDTVRISYVPPGVSHRDKHRYEDNEKTCTHTQFFFVRVETCSKTSGVILTISIIFVMKKNELT